MFEEKGAAATVVDESRKRVGWLSIKRKFFYIVMDNRKWNPRNKYRRIKKTLEVGRLDGEQPRRLGRISSTVKWAIVHISILYIGLREMPYTKRQMFQHKKY